MQPALQGGGGTTIRYLSLCSGIEAATVAWRPLGWEPAAFAEIDPYACELLRQRYPDVPNLGDLSAITEADLRAIGPVGAVVGGTPCQDLSVAGRRQGIDGARSRLFYDYSRICHAVRAIHGTRFAIWENVDFAISANDGRDFAVVVSALTGCEHVPPADGWGSEGVAVGPRAKSCRR